VQASKPSGEGPQRKFKIKLNEPETPEGVLLVTFIV
jgi:hypothetical protein